jgi:predicted cupin superfamily sugar epimerase
MSHSAPGTPPLAAPTAPSALPPRAAELIGDLGLTPHLEGGYFRELFRARDTVQPSDARGPRPALTTIYFLLAGTAVSRWHRVRSHEVWHHYEGAPLELLTIPHEEVRLERAILGPYGAEQAPVHCVPAGWWQAARSLGAYTLVGCTVGPGFEYSDFELLADRPELAGSLSGALPEVAQFVGSLED